MNWIERDNALHLDLRTPDFMTAYKMVSALVGPAEAANHHPDLAFGWGYVRIKLTTHDAGGVTAQDRAMALKIDEALKPFGV
ncbi:MAG TPA: 4a-hydroxytetrahydrobiopterin dehydratase [Holophagaceae bacterium]|nr:4a-hydroxytetrahydrobiopterin dehydratase [Holophagaceae bacterium]